MNFFIKNNNSSSQQHTIKVAYFQYNIKDVTIVLKDHLSLNEKYYVENDIVKLPFWYAKLLYSRDVCQLIQELVEFDKIFIRAIGDQMLNKNTLVKIQPDFYFECADYFNHYVKKGNQKREKLRKIKEFKTQREIIIMKILERGNNINKNQIQNMAFEEILFYEQCLRAKKDPYCIINSVIDKIEEEVTI